MTADQQAKPLTPHDVSPGAGVVGDGVANADARAVAFVRKRAPRRRELASASAGAPVAFTNLCIALAEAPVGAHVHEIDVAGVGRVSWKAAPANDDSDSELVVFTLHNERETTGEPVRRGADPLAAFR